MVSVSRTKSAHRQQTGQSGPSPDDRRTCLWRKCSPTKTASGRGCCSRSRTVAGKTSLRLAGNLERQERTGIVGELKSKPNFKQFCVRTRILEWSSPPFPAAVQLASGRDVDNQQRRSRASCCQHSLTGLSHVNFCCHVNTGRSFGGRRNRIHDLVPACHHQETHREDIHQCERSLAGL